VLRAFFGRPGPSEFPDAGVAPGRADNDGPGRSAGRRGGDPGRLAAAANRHTDLRFAARAGEASALARSGQPGHPHAMPLNLTALETSFDLIAPRGDELVDTFYARLFAAAPAVRPLFARTDLRRQKTMLLGALVLLRKSLRDLDAIVPTLRDMGARHVAYGAEAAHYPVVGQVLIASMAEIAGDAWRAEYEHAWAEAFDIVAGAMLDGAASVQERLAA
jgi:hemoglobin-like flavoprotein